MKRLSLFIIFIFTVNFAALGGNFTGTPDEFIVTINLVEFLNSTTNEWIVAGSGDYSFDITSVQPGQLCGGYGSPENFTPGVYTAIRVTVSRTIQITGIPTAHGGNTYYTRTGTATTFNTNMNVGGDAKGRCGQANITGPAQRVTTVLPSTAVTLAADTDYFIFQTNLTSSATLSPGTAMRAKIDFDAASVITYDHTTVAPVSVSYIGAAPTMTVAFY